MAVPDRIQEILERARQRRAQFEAENREVDPRAVAEGAAEGAAIGAAALPATAELARRAVSPAGGPSGPAVSPRAGGRRGMAVQLAREIGETALRNPKMTAATELAGGAGAGAAMAYADQEGATPAEQSVAGIAGGLLSGASPVLLPNVARRAARWIGENVTPFLPSQGEIRAARQLQGDVGNDPQYLEQLSQRVREGSPDISPARLTQDQRLMAREARVMAEDPNIERKIQSDLAQASRRAQDELKELYSTPAGRQEWEQTVIERVAAPGTELKPGFTDEMLDQAYQSFDPLYAPVKEFAIKLQIVRPGRTTPLRTLLNNAPNTRTVIADDATRDSVRKWLMNEYSILRRQTDKKGLVTAGDLLALRSSIRARARKEARDPRKSDTVDLLRHAEDRVTEVLGSQLPQSARDTLRMADRQYAQYKTVEDAVYRSIDRQLTPENLLRSIKTGAPSHGMQARGETSQQLYDLAQVGRDMRQLMRDPRLARQAARSADPGQLRDLHGDFVGELSRRSMRTADDGTEYVSGAKFLDQLRQNMDTARGLGINDRDMARLRRIGSELRSIEMKSPAATAQLIEDGPATIMQLFATLVGAKQGQRIGAGGMGSSLVLAGFFARRARAFLSHLTMGQAEKILMRAHTDPKLYSALLTKPTDPVAKQMEAVRTLQAWLGMPTGEVLESAEMDELREDAMGLMGQ